MTIISTATVEEKTATLTAMRWPERASCKRIIKACQLEGAVIDMDKDGWFIHSFTMPAWFAALPTMAEVEAYKAANPAPVTPERAPIVKRDDNGPCAQIRAWTAANPAATKDDAIAHFPDLNRATVSIQFKKARS